MRAGIGKVLRARFDHHLRRLFPGFGRGRKLYGDRVFSAPIEDLASWHVVLHVARDDDSFGVSTAWTRGAAPPAAQAGLVFSAPLEPASSKPDTWVQAPVLWLRGAKRPVAEGHWRVTPLWFIRPPLSLEDWEQRLMAATVEDPPVSAEEIDAFAVHATTMLVRHGLAWLQGSLQRHRLRAVLPWSSDAPPELEPVRVPRVEWCPKRDPDEVRNEIFALAKRMEGIGDQLEAARRTRRQAARAARRRQKPS